MKKVLKAIWNEFVYGGHLLSLGAVSIVYTASVILSVKTTWDFLLIVYLGTESVYLYNRLKEYKIDFLTNPKRTEHIKNYVKFIPLIISIFSLAIVLLLIYEQKFSALLFAVILLIMGFLYSEIFKNYTKKVIGFKNLFVAFMWASLIIFLAVYFGLSFNLSLTFLFVFVFLRWAVNTSLFDYKDTLSDKKERLLTLVNILGEKKTFYLLNVISILAIIPIVLGIYLNYLPKFSLILILTMFYSFYYLKKVLDKNGDNEFLYNVIIDGEFILWTLFINLGKYIL
jgi:4-hydroxybenzoate polyprenyltransferase